MMGQRSIQDQLQAFKDTVATNELVTTILDRASALALPQWYLAGGCLFQTVWNVQHGFAPTRNILDYDLFFFDSADMSREAEDRVAQAFADLPVKVEVTNQARVHLWYTATFGAPCDAFRSCEDGIDAFLANTCCLGIRQVAGDSLIYAPHGFADLFNMVVRPNATRALGSAALREVYGSKTQRWLQSWPRLKVLPWPS